MINEEMLLEAFGNIEDEYLCEEYNIHRKTNKIINLGKYIEKIKNTTKKSPKKYISIASASVLAITLGIVVSTSKLNEKEIGNDESVGFSNDSVSIANPLTEVSSIKDMEKCLGFDVPVLNKDVEQYLVIGEENNAVQGRILYEDGTEFDIAKGNEDVSGIYGGKLEKTEIIEGVKVSYYKQENTNYVIWNNNGYSYSYQNTYGKINKNELTKLIQLAK